MKDFFGFASALLGSLVLWLCPAVSFAQEASTEPDPIETTETPNETISNATEKSEESEPSSDSELAEVLPSWLLEKAFSLRSRLVMNLDGSEAANDLHGSSETIDRVEFQDPSNWRMLRQLPFLFERQEYVCRESVIYSASLSNRLHIPRQEIDPWTWVHLFEFPYQLAKDWSYISDSASWDDWFQKLAKQSEKFENPIGDSIEVTVSTEENFKVLEIRMTGKYAHQGTTETLLDLEWRLEYDKAPSSIKLEESLMVGGTAS